MKFFFYFQIKMTHRSLFYLSVALLIFWICMNVENVSAQTMSIKTRDEANFKIFCEDKILVSVWDKIRNEFKNYSTEDLITIGGKNCINLFEIKQILDLNADGQEESAVRKIADCPDLINCGLWIFQKEKNKYRTILDAKDIERFSLEKTKTNDYTDIQSRTHITGTSHYFQSFKFKGKKYTPQKCWWEDYAVPDEKGNFYELKKPRIRFVKCGEYSYSK